MYKDLSLKEKAKVIREGVRLGLNSINDILSLYDEAISYLQGGPIGRWLTKKWYNWNVLPKVDELGIDEVRQRLYDNIYPLYYENAPGRIRKALKNIPDNYMESDELKYMPERDDIWAEYLLIPKEKRHKDKDIFNKRYTISKSNYSPSKGNNDNSTYYKINKLPSFLKKDLIEDVFGSDRFLGRHGSPLKFGESTVASPLDKFFGPHTISRGVDKQKGEYVSYYDLWDLAPLTDKGDESLGLGKPLEFYDRVYLDDYYGINTSPEKGTYYGGYLAPVTVTPNEYKKGGPIVTPYGQWQYPGRDTIIPSNNITMDNVNYPVLGISDAGDTKVMMPWNDYKFRGSMVYEHPLIGNQFQLGGNTNPTFDLWYLTVPNQKNNTSSYDLRRAYNMFPFDEMEKFRTINNYHLPSVAYDEKTDTYTFLKRNGHPTLNYELNWYNSESPDALLFRERYKLDTLSLPWRYIPNYDKGGSIHIDPKNKGKLTDTMRRTGKSKYELAHSKNPLTRKRALFAINASHWKHLDGGHLFLEDGQIFKRPLDDLTGRNILTSPILPPKSYYEQFTVPELEPKRPQPLLPLEGTYGNKYSELAPMSDGTYVNNPINKGLQQDWRTHALEFAPFLAIGAGPAIGSTATWLATSKPALYNLGRMTLSSEIGGRSVDLASNLLTGNTWGLNVGNVVEGATGWNPNNTMVGLFVTDLTNPGYSIGLGKNIKLKKDIDPNRLFSYSEAEYIKPEDFPQVNIFKNQKPKLDVENYLQKHKQRIVDKYGEDAYNKIKLYTYNQDEKSIKKAIRDAIWDDTHNLIYTLDNNFINLKYKDLAKQPAFNIGRQAIVVNPELTKKIYPSVFELYGDDAALGLIKSHELEHAINWYRQMHPDQKATNGIFDLTKILKDSTKNYFEKQNNTELSARGSLIKDYFDSDIITGDLLRFAARNYVKDTGIDNNMTEFFNGIKDWDGMAKWITKNSSIIATPFLIGSVINKYDKDLKNN